VGRCFRRVQQIISPPHTAHTAHTAHIAQCSCYGSSGANQRRACQPLLPLEEATDTLTLPTTQHHHYPIPFSSITVVFRLSTGEGKRVTTYLTFMNSLCAYRHRESCLKEPQGASRSLPSNPRKTPSLGPKMPSRRNQKRTMKYVVNVICKKSSPPSAIRAVYPP